MKKLILLVDDDERCSGLASFLERDDHLVIHATGPDDALSLLMQGIAIDLLIAEQFLPGANVMAFLNFIHRFKPRLPIIVITMSPQTEQPREKGSCFIEYLHRPFAMTEALGIINRLLHRTGMDAPVTPARHDERQDWSTAS